MTVHTVHSTHSTQWCLKFKHRKWCHDLTLPEKKGHLSAKKRYLLSDCYVKKLTDIHLRFLITWFYLILNIQSTLSQLSSKSNHSISQYWLIDWLINCCCCCCCCCSHAAAQLLHSWQPAIPSCVDGLFCISLSQRVLYTHQSFHNHDLFTWMSLFLALHYKWQLDVVVWVVTHIHTLQLWRVHVQQSYHDRLMTFALVSSSTALLSYWSFHGFPYWSFKNGAQQP